MSLPPAYRVRDLDWRLGDDFSLSIPYLDIVSGKSTVILGRSGSGKSSLLSLLGRVEGGYFIGSGVATGAVHLHLDAHSIPLELLALSERQLLRRRVRGVGVGFVFQREGLFPDRDVLGNVTWALALAHPKLSASALQAAGEAVLADVGLAPDRRVATLSGGERKRLALARALALDPPVLLLDEPLTGLDPEALGGLRALLLKLREVGRTIVMVTHQRDDVLALADEVVFLDAGRVILAGPVAALEAELDRFFAGEMPRGPEAGSALPSTEVSE